MSSYQHVKSSRANLKYRIMYVMGDKCCICGYNKSRTALELHHLVPSEKDFTFSRNANLAWNTVVKELPKCVLVCANCHREIHEKVTESPNTTTFRMERATEVFQDNYDLTHHIIKTCPFCGAIISKDAKTCVNCFNLRRRKVERPTKEILKEEIRQYSFTALGKKYSVSDTAIRKWCITYGLPSKSKEIKGYSDEQWELI